MLQQNADLSALPLPPPMLYLQRSEAQLVALYGQEVAHKLFMLSAGSWHQLRSNRGVHLVRIDARTQANEPGLAAVREQLIVDYRTAATQRVIATEIARLQAQWPLQREGAP
jgi:hypothetical protein